MAVVRSLGLDVELASRPGVRAADALLDVDRLVEVAEEFVASGEDPGLLAFLAYLDTAEERERGLEVEVAEPDGSRVQLMTVHAAKGLEWDVVVVAGLTKTVFPVDNRPVADWTKQGATLPFPLRGDRAELPVLRWEDADDQVAAHELLDGVPGRLPRARGAGGAPARLRRGDPGPRPAALLGLLVGRRREEEARAVRTCWPSSRELCRAGGGEIATWADEPTDDDTNPLAADPVWAQLAVRPAGASAGRPSQDGADLVRAAADRPAPAVPDRHRDRVEAWDAELELLLAELARKRRATGSGAVELPSRLSVSQLVDAAARPDRAGPLAAPPAAAQAGAAGPAGHPVPPLARGRAGGSSGCSTSTSCPEPPTRRPSRTTTCSPCRPRSTRARGPSRVPAEVELPFDMVVDGLLLRGRCDAVFTDAPDGTVDVVDWKTGPPKTGAEATAAAVQLAVYRLAWHHLTGEPLDNIRAAFHHVAANVTVRPADLLDEQALTELIRSVPAA